MQKKMVVVDLSELETIEASNLQAVAPVLPGGICGLGCGGACGIGCGAGCYAT